MVKIAFQGIAGAYSHQACVEAFPKADLLPCNTFEGAIAAVRAGDADMAMVPVENSTYGRVADIHQLLPKTGLKIVAEHYVRVHINLLGIKGADLGDIKTALSHTVLLGQCRDFLHRHNIAPQVGPDTAGSAQIVAKANEKTQAALASELAAQTYGLVILKRHIEDCANNTTRFLVMSRDANYAQKGAGQIKTSFVFGVRNIPAALYKAMGGFATNGVNMVKLESYMLDGSFTATQFYADVLGHPDDENVMRAMEELRYFSDYVEILGVYKAATPALS